jgi:hypothetical protein
MPGVSEGKEKLYREETNNKINTKTQSAKERAKRGYRERLRWHDCLQIPLLAPSLAG